jgi:hypothetical protein
MAFIFNTNAHKRNENKTLIGKSEEKDLIGELG